MMRPGDDLNRIQLHKAQLLDQAQGIQGARRHLPKTMRREP